jgi:hypothetical protein
VQQSLAHGYATEAGRILHLINSPIYDTFFVCIYTLNFKQASNSQSAIMSQDSTRNSQNKTVHEIESEFHGHDGPPFDSLIVCRATEDTLRPYLEGQLSHIDHYFQEIERVVEYLTRCVDRLKYLREGDVEVFDYARKHHRDRHGEDPLRGWEVRLYAMMGMIRDLRDEEKIPVS